MKVFKKLSWLLLFVMFASVLSVENISPAMAYEPISEEVYISADGVSTAEMDVSGLHFSELTFYCEDRGTNSERYGVTGTVETDFDFPVVIANSIRFYSEDDLLLNVLNDESKIENGPGYNFTKTVFKDDENNENVCADDIAYCVFASYILTDIDNPGEDGENYGEFIPTLPEDTLNSSDTGASMLENYNNLTGANQENSSYFDMMDYYLNSYNVEIYVNENNTYDISEEIEAVFNEYKHGIVRSIPTKDTVTREDGTQVSSRSIVSGLSVNEPYSVSGGGGYKDIKIGDEDRLIKGSKYYQIYYNYNCGLDKLENEDEFYYNIIGPEWDTSIRNVSFTITMPKEFDTSKIAFLHEKYMVDDESDVQYKVDGNVISGFYSGTLRAGEALTIRVSLPDGYYVGAKSTDNETAKFLYKNIKFIAIIIPLIFVFIAFIIWFIFGRDKKPVVTVEFNPPYGVNSLLAGYIYKGKINDKDIVSLLLYLASKEYISIDENPDYSENNKDSYSITMLKPYDGMDENEAEFMQGLFGSKTTVTSSELKNKFYRTVNKIRSNAAKEAKKGVIYKHHPAILNVLLYLLIVATLVLTNMPAVVTQDILYEDNAILYMFVNSLAFLMPDMFIGIALVVMIMNVFNNKDKIANKIFMIIWCIGFGGIPLIGFIIPLLHGNPASLLSFAFGFVCVGLIFMFIKLMPQRTAYGDELFGKILGFKNFLETAEKSRIEALVLDNPSYFYDVLPYAYVLDVSDKWISNFEMLAMEPPTWYRGTRFNHASLTHFMNNSMNSFSRAMTSSPKSSSSSGGHGGGHSGGGHGGGGGHSW